MYKLLLALILTTFLLNAEDKESQTKELVKYSYFCLNDSLNLYAAKVNMKNFEDDLAYSIGLVLNNDKKSDAEFGVGYMKASTDVAYLWSSSIIQSNEKNEDGWLFFMNYKF